MIFLWKDWKSVYFIGVEIRKRVDRNSLLFWVLYLGFEGIQNGLIFI